MLTFTRYKVTTVQGHKSVCKKKRFCWNKAFLLGQPGLFTLQIIMRLKCEIYSTPSDELFLNIKTDFLPTFC